MLIIDVIYKIYSIYTFIDRLYIFSYNLDANIITLLRYSIVMYYQWYAHDNDKIDETIEGIHVAVDIWYWI